MANQHHDQHTNVTEIYVTFVKRNKAPVFRKWLEKMRAVEATFPGFQKVYVQAPQNQKSGSWVTLLQFDTEEHLDHWFNSPERATLLQEASTLVKSQEIHRLQSSFEGWFTNRDSPQITPPAWKQTMLVLLVLFPAVMLEAQYISPLMTNVDRVITIFINLAITVCLISWPLMPIAIHVLSWWLNPQSKMREYLGVFTVVLLYILEIGMFIEF